MRAVASAAPTRRVRIAATVAWVGFAVWASADAAERFAPGEPMAIESCAGGPGIRLRSDDRRALLDEGDRKRLQDAMTARYSVLQRDGFAPVQILMWRKAPNELLFVTLAPNFDAADALCFTATFAAEIFELTPALTRKYFFEGPART